MLYIDLDPQMNLSTTLKAQTGGVLSSLDVLTGEAGVAAAAQTIDGYDAVPASRLNGKADDLMPSVGKDYRLRKALGGRSPIAMTSRSSTRRRRSTRSR